MRRFEGTTAIITGGGHGIGRATALRLAAEGGRVVLFEKEADWAAGVAAELEGEGHRAITADIGDAASIRAALHETLAAYERIDILVNNAAYTRTDSLVNLDEAAWQEEFRVTLDGAFRLCHALLPHMIEKGGGTIVSVASVNGLMYFGNPAYSAAKAGLINLMQSIAVEHGPKGIRANTVSPGTVNTGNRSWQRRMARDPGLLERLEKWYPVGRLGKAEDIAAAIAFLAADEAAFVNGANLVVDGGLTAGTAPMFREIAG